MTRLAVTKRVTAAAVAAIRMHQKPCSASSTTCSSLRQQRCRLSCITTVLLLHLHLLTSTHRCHLCRVVTVILSL